MADYPTLCDFNGIRADAALIASSRYWFDCRCVACEEDWPDYDQYDINKILLRCPACGAGIENEASGEGEREREREGEGGREGEREREREGWREREIGEGGRGRERERERERESRIILLYF